ncbi:MAG TPA: sulfotransferase [Solirubrobacterales bacterium]|jgi:hypothetical protein
MDERRLIWIFGSSRSGSTWLLKMLSEFDGVVPIDDPHLGHHLGVWRPIPLAWAVADGEPPDLTTLLDLKAEEPCYFFSERHRESWWEPLRQLIAARFDSQVAEHGSEDGRALLVVKEPGSHVAPLLTALFPAGRLIFLLRDGRDVVDSWLAAYREGAWAIPGGAFPVSEQGRIPLIRWLSAVWAYRSRAVRDAYEATRPENRLMLRYEDLLGEATRSLERLCDLLGLDRREAAAVAARHSFERLPPGSRGPHLRERAASPGAWRRNLTENEQQAMHAEIGGALAEFGYDPVVPPVVAA